MKLFSKIRYFFAVLLVLISVSGIISPSRGTGMITTLYDHPVAIETR